MGDYDFINQYPITQIKNMGDSDFIEAIKCLEYDLIIGLEEFGRLKKTKKY